MPTFAAWSQAFLGDVAEDLFTCFLEEAEWRQVHDAFATAKRIFAVLTIRDQKFTCALGHPVRSSIDTEDETERVFLPPWLLQASRLEGLGEHVAIEWITEEHVPEATKIVLRPHEAAFYGANAKEELEPALTRYGILMAGSTVPVPIEALDGYVILFDVLRTEPADMVLMEGDEVAIDFEAALDYVEPVAAAVTAPAAVAPEVESKEEPFEEMITTSSVAITQPEGRTLGGTARPRLPDGRPWNPYRNA